MTGSVFVDRPVSERADELAELEAAMFPRSAAEPITVPGWTLDDDQVLARARAAKNADKFTRLWAGDTSGYGSASEADLLRCRCWRSGPATPTSWSAVPPLRADA